MPRSGSSLIEQILSTHSQVEGLGELKNPTHRVLVQRTFIYTNETPKSNSLLYLPMGAKILVQNIKSEILTNGLI